MRPNYLPIILLLCIAGTAHAKFSLAKPPASLSEFKQSIAATPGPAYYGSHARLHFYFNVLDIGYSKMKAKDAAGKTTSGGGLRIGGSLGLNIELGNEQSANRNSMVSIGVALHAITIKSKYNDASGNKRTSKLELTTVSVPVSYTRLFYLNGDGAAFVQLGLVAGMVTDAKLDEKPAAQNYNNVFIEPMISIGGSSLLHVAYRQSGNTLFDGRAFFCPYFGYIVNNISSVPGTTMNGFDVGVRWVYSGW